MKCIIYTDGGARPTNPGHSGFACVLTINGDYYIISRYIGWRTNNVAEYFGVVTALKYALELGATDIILYTDSQLVRNQIEENWRCKDDELKVLQKEAIKLLEKFPSWKIKWIKRDKNKQADKLCTDAIYAGMRRTNRFMKKIPAGKEIDPFLLQ